MLKMVLNNNKWSKVICHKAASPPHVDESIVFDR